MSKYILYDSVEKVLPVFKMFFFIPALKSSFLLSVTGLWNKAAIFHLRTSIYIVVITCEISFWRFSVSCERRSRHHT